MLLTICISSEYEKNIGYSVRKRVQSESISVSKDTTFPFRLNIGPQGNYVFWIYRLLFSLYPFNLKVQVITQCQGYNSCTLQYRQWQADKHKRSSKCVWICPSLDSLCLTYWGSYDGASTGSLWSLRSLRSWYTCFTHWTSRPLERERERENIQKES